MNATVVLREAPTRPLSMSTAEPFISVIVPVRNEARHVASTLDQLLAQRYDPCRFEVLVADGGSIDATREIAAGYARRHANVRLLDNAGGWSSAGRNVAVRAARGDLIVLVDGHCRLDGPDFLADTADAFARSRADCLGRPQPLDLDGATPFQRAVAAARSSRLGHHPASFIYAGKESFVPPQSVAVAYRRQVFGTVGLFDEAFDACEDVEFNHRVARAGMRCFFTPRVQVHYRPRATLAGLFRQMTRYGRGRTRLLRKHPETFSVPGFLPAAFLGGAALGPLFAVWSPVLAAAYFAVLAIYVVTVLTFSAAVGVGRRDPAILPWLPLVYVVVHTGAGWGVLWEAVAGRKPTRPAPALPTPAVGPMRQAA
jgi:succinoglycan biosynthesis protein ExoA